MEFASCRQFFKIFSICECIEHKLDAILCLFLRGLFLSYIRCLESYDIRAILSFFYQTPSSFQPIGAEVNQKLPFYRSRFYAVFFLRLIKLFNSLFACLVSL